jgi:hypothetical protein
MVVFHFVVTTATNEKELSVLQEELLKADKIHKASIVNDNFVMPKYEVTLANYNFGFNDKSNDFFVKVSRGSVENQYPTEDMMRLKAYLMSMADKSVIDAS